MRSFFLNELGGPAGRVIGVLEGFDTTLGLRANVPFVVSSNIFKVTNPGLVAPGFTARSLSIPSSFSVGDFLTRGLGHDRRSSPMVGSFSIVVSIAHARS